MNERLPLVERIRHAVDRWAWALGAWRTRLLEAGWWLGPVARAVAVPPGQDEHAWCIRGARAWSCPAPARPRALALPSRQAVRGEFVLGPLRLGELEQAVTEALWSHAPLPLDRMVAAWCAEPAGVARWRVRWLLVAQSDVQHALAVAGVASDAPVFIVVDGRAWWLRTPGGQRWHRRQRLWDTVAAAAVVLALAAVALPAFVPAALQRQGVVLAMQRAVDLQPRAEPVRQRLDLLRQQAEQWQVLRQASAQAVPVARLIEALAAELPDDTMLDRLEFSGADVRITGLTPNATALLARLAQQPLWAEVRASQASVRDPASGKERFTFELRRAVQEDLR